MQDFAAELRAVRDPAGRDMKAMAGESSNVFEMYLVQNAARSGFELGYEAGRRAADAAADKRVAYVRESSRHEGFDAAVRVLLVHTLLGLQGVAAELESRRAHKVMVERTRAKLGELVSQLESVATVLPPVHPQQLGMDEIRIPQEEL